jgi:hypothetical protein
MKRELPTYPIEGTEFLLDVSCQELKEVKNPSNTISFLEMKDHGTHYTLNYDPESKNLPGLFGKNTVGVEIPQMVKLDPEGMATHYSLSVDELKGKTDFEIIVNQDLVALREKGALPIIDIAGHPFYVDLRMDSLRPKDDFRTMGIQFSEIDHCLFEDERVYRFTYDPASHSYVDIDVNRITAVPKDLIIVEVPYKSTLDPIGYARWLGIDSKDMLREHPPQAEMKARIVPWSETPIAKLIERNLNRIHEPKSKYQQTYSTDKTEKRKRPRKRL